MAWIESHQALGHHPKTLALAAAFKCTVPAAVGYMHFLWWWALDYAPDGVVKPALQVQTARACLWHGAPDRFWSGLVEAGFVDERVADGVLVIHDWMDYAGRIVSKRAANAQRMRDARASHVQEKNVHVQGLPTNRTNQPYQPDTNQPDKPLPPYPPSEPSEGGTAPPTGADLSTNGHTRTRRARPKAEIAETCCPNFAKFGEHWVGCPLAEVAAEVPA